MCKFMQDLIPKHFAATEELDDLECKYRQFKAIPIKSNLWLSIQASYAHYSRPRTTLDDLDEYSHWELALFDKDDFLGVDSVLPDFKSLSEIMHYFDGSVFSYVPTDLVEELYLALK